MRLFDDPFEFTEIMKIPNELDQLPLKTILTYDKVLYCSDHEKGIFQRARAQIHVVLVLIDEDGRLLTLLLGGKKPSSGCESYGIGIPTSEPPDQYFYDRSMHENIRFALTVRQINYGHIKHNPDHPITNRAPQVILQGSDNKLTMTVVIPLALSSQNRAQVHEEIATGLSRNITWCDIATLKKVLPDPKAQGENTARIVKLNGTDVNIVNSDTMRALLTDPGFAKTLERYKKLRPYPYTKLLRGLNHTLFNPFNLDTAACDILENLLLWIVGIDTVTKECLTSPPNEQDDIIFIHLKGIEEVYVEALIQQFNQKYASADDQPIMTAYVGKNYHAAPPIEGFDYAIVIFTYLFATNMQCHADMRAMLQQMQQNPSHKHHGLFCKFQQETHDYQKQREQADASSASSSSAAAASFAAAAASSAASSASPPNPRRRHQASIFAPDEQRVLHTTLTLPDDDPLGDAPAAVAPAAAAAAATNPHTVMNSMTRKRGKTPPGQSKKPRTTIAAKSFKTP